MERDDLSGRVLTPAYMRSLAADVRALRRWSADLARRSAEWRVAAAAIAARSEAVRDRARDVTERAVRAADGGG